MIVAAGFGARQSCASGWKWAKGSRLFKNHPVYYRRAAKDACGLCIRRVGPTKREDGFLRR